MYTIQVKDKNGVIKASRDMGYWRDRAAEKYGSVRRRAPVSLTVELINTDTGETLYTSNGEKCFTTEDYSK